jgi:hypothetical protein
MHPPTVCSREHVPSAVAAGPASQAAVSGLPPFPESLADLHGFNMPTAGCSLGVPLLGFSRENLDRDFDQSPVSRFSEVHSATQVEHYSRGASQYHSVLAWSYLLIVRKRTMLSRTTLRGFSHPHRPVHSNELHSGYLLTSRRVVHYCRLVGVLRMEASLYRSCQDCLRCQAFALLF